MLVKYKIMESAIGDKPMPKKLARLLEDLLENEWGILDEPWPMCPKIETFHRSELKPIARIQEMKTLLMKRLGSIAVFFILSKIWSKHYFSGPYSALEKGIAFLYFFVAVETLDSMWQCMPKSTFHFMYSTFVKIERALFEKEIKRSFATMVSNRKIRHYSSM